MTLRVQSARINYGGPDRLDVTRKSGTDGLFLAPSWAILRPALEARKWADGMMRVALDGITADAGNEYPEFDPFPYQSKAENIIAQSWSSYVPAYLGEMRRSYVENRAQWSALLARERVVLCCYCTDREHCHRAILRARILPALGAVDDGEVQHAAQA